MFFYLKLKKWNKMIKQYNNVKRYVWVNNSRSSFSFSGIDVAELNAIATDSHHVFDVRNYSDLPTILPQVMDIVCNA